jgi:DNA-binding response OmpR family regulator
MNPAQSSIARLLIIDDNPNIHRDFDLVLLDTEQNAELEADEQRMFGQPGRPARVKPSYSLDHALSGLEGLDRVQKALAEERPYQLAFVDIRMPGIDGVETIQRLWRLDPRVQIVICTAFADYSWDELVERLGQTDKLLVLKKPFDNIEVTLLASTLTEKWYLARRAALKLEQMELLVARRTQRVLDLQGNHAQPIAADTAAAANSEHPLSGNELPVVLVVETDAELRQQVRESLEAGYRVVDAKDGEAGLREAHDVVPDIVLAGIVLPGLNGLALCRQLKGAELTSHIPVILLAATDFETAQIQALEAGADDCLAQPARPPLLRARVDNLLRAGRQLHELFGQETTLQARDLAANQVDAQFLRRVIDTVEAHLTDFEFNVDVMAQKLAVSRRQLFRKLKAVTGCTPNTFLRSMRLKQAARLLEESPMTVTEITYAVGFSDLKHFRTVFREHFGVLPAEYSKKASPKVP